MGNSYDVIRKINSNTIAKNGDCVCSAIGRGNTQILSRYDNADTTVGDVEERLINRFDDLDYAFQILP